MTLLRCQKLAQVISAWSGDTNSGPQISATVSGQVFSYGGHAYLIPSAFALGGTSEPAVPASAPATAEPVKKKAPEPVQADADAKQLMERLESRPRPRRAVDRVRASSSETAVVTPAAPATADAPAPKAHVDRAPVSLVPEGTAMVARRGRLVRYGPDSELAFAADNGPDNAVHAPMVLLPCRVLEQMEWAAGAYGDNIAMKVSGRVMVFQGKNYLLPTMYQIMRAGDVVPQQ